MVQSINVSNDFHALAKVIISENDTFSIIINFRFGKANLSFDFCFDRRYGNASTSTSTECFLSSCALNKSSAKNKSFSFGAKGREGETIREKGAARDSFLILCCKKNHLDIYYWYYTTLNIIIIFPYRSCCRFFFVCL